MSRISSNVCDSEGYLYNGFDYTKQVWVVDGKFTRCGHPDKFNCTCFGRMNEGKKVKEWYKEN